MERLIQNSIDEINYLVGHEGFEKKEAIKLVLLMASLQEISGKLDQ